MAKQIINAIFPEELYIFLDEEKDCYYRVTNLNLFAESVSKTSDQIKNLVYRKAKRSGSLTYIGKGNEPKITKKVLFN